MSKYIYKGEKVEVEFGEVLISLNKIDPLFWLNYEVHLAERPDEKAVVKVIKCKPNQSRSFVLINHFGVGVNFLQLHTKYYSIDHDKIAYDIGMDIQLNNEKLFIPEDRIEKFTPTTKDAYYEIAPDLYDIYESDRGQWIEKKSIEINDIFKIESGPIIEEEGFEINHEEGICLACCFRYPVPESLHYNLKIVQCPKCEEPGYLILTGQKKH